MKLNLERETESVSFVYSLPHGTRHFYTLLCGVVPLSFYEFDVMSETENGTVALE